MFLWYAAGVFASVAIAWLAAMLHRFGFAPLGIVSIAVGIALGATLGAIAANQRITGGRTLVIGAVVLSLVVVLAEHAWLYRDFRRQWHEARAESPEVAIFRPETPWSPREYLAHELSTQRAALWCLDAALITTAAVATVVVLKRNQV